MPSFHELRFPDDISFGATGGPEFKTVINEKGDGSEQRNVSWSKARASWDVATAIKDEDSYAVVLAFHYARFGRAYGFRWKDWFDFKAEGEVIGTGNDVLDTFQLIKTYDSSPDASPGTYTYVRTILKPVQGSVVVKLGAAVQVETTDYVLDYATGVIVFTDPVPDTTIVSWTGEFDVPVRFDSDKLNSSYEAFNQLENQQISVIELKRLPA